MNDIHCSTDEDSFSLNARWRGGGDDDDTHSHSIENSHQTLKNMHANTHFALYIWIITPHSIRMYSKNNNKIDE